MSETASNPYTEDEKLSLFQLIRNWVPMLFYTGIFGGMALLPAIAPGRKISRWAMHQWSSRMKKSLGIRCELIGAELLESSPQCIFIANHCSALDILIVGSFLPRDFRWLAKAPLFRKPFMGWHLKAAGHICVYRGDEKFKNEDIQDRIGVAISEGASILYFPEGTRNRDGRLQPFRRGAFVSAATHNLPLVPMVLKGTGELMKKGARHINVDRSRTCTLTVLPPISIPESKEDQETRASRLHGLAQEAFEQELGQKTSGDEEARQ